MADEIFDRYKQDRDRRTYERLIEAHRPMVASVCRRLLRDPNDIDDAVQETFCKLAGHSESITGSVIAWLSRTAHSTSVDLIRGAIRERNRRTGLAKLGSPNGEDQDQAMRFRLHDAMLALQPSARDLLLDRFVHRIPLRVVAAKLHTSVPTASRRVNAAIAELAKILQDLGVQVADEKTVTEQIAYAEDDGMRFAPDWRDTALSPLGSATITARMAGWTRPMRIGAVLSYASLMSPRAVVSNGLVTPPSSQLNTTLKMTHPGLQFVGIVEPGTDTKGIIECSLRDYGLVGGLIEADDAAALRSLDVILLGNYTHDMPATIGRALVDAVRGGVGLLNECWAGRMQGAYSDPDLLALLLADSPIYAYHTPGQCCLPRPATVVREHSLLPGLRAGTKLSVDGCGPAYRLRADAQILIARDHPIAPQVHKLAGLGALPMPVYAVGNLDKGRVAVVQNWPHWGRREKFVRYFDVSLPQYVTNLLAWLAEPRREIA